MHLIILLYFFANFWFIWNTKGHCCTTTSHSLDICPRQTLMRKTKAADLWHGHCGIHIIPLSSVTKRLNALDIYTLELCICVAIANQWPACWLPRRLVFPTEKIQKNFFFATLGTLTKMAVCLKPQCFKMHKTSVIVIHLLWWFFGSLTIYCEMHLNWVTLRCQIFAVCLRRPYSVFHVIFYK